jgi:DNA-binding transcriptional MerR regulator
LTVGDPPEVDPPAAAALSAGDRPGAGGASGFTIPQAARLSGCTVAQLDHWRRTGLVGPAPGSDVAYTFRDLVALRMVRSLLDAGLAPARIRRAVAELTRGGDDITELRLVTDGVQVWACRDDGQILDALRHGQLALFVAVDRLAADLEADVRQFSRERQSFVDDLRRRPDHPAGSG